MKININALGLDLTPALNQYVEEKVGSLSRFLKFCESEVQFRVEVARSTKHHHRGEVFRAEINLNLPKKNLRSVVEREDIRTAINEARNELRREIKNYSQKSRIQNDKKLYREILKRKGEV